MTKKYKTTIFLINTEIRRAHLELFGLKPQNVLLTDIIGNIFLEKSHLRLDMFLTFSI